MISLDDRKWKQFKISYLFGKPISGNDYPKRARISGITPLVGDSTSNNGIIDFISHKTPKTKLVKNIISVNAYGNPGVAYYHKYPCYIYRDVQYLTLKNEDTYVGLFITTCIRQQRHQYDFGFQLNNTRLKNLVISLPIDKSSHPDWQFMADYMKQVRSEIPSSYVHNHVSHPKYSLDDRKWRQFRIKDIGRIQQSKRYARKNRKSGQIPYVERSVNNNGLTDFISIDKNTPKSFYKNVVSVNASGAPGYAFYHPYVAYFADGVDVLKFKDLNWASGLFIVTCIRQQHTQFNYGFELYNAQLKNLKINLPVTTAGYPDWEFMRNYMKSMLR